MQPYLHIFSHSPVSTSSFLTKPLLSSDICAVGRFPPARARAQHPVQTLALNAQLQRGVLRAGAGAAVRSPSRRPLPRRPAGTERSHALTAATAPMPRASSLRARLGGCVTLVALTAALAGCGSSSGGGTAADPASAVPASAAIYAGATVRPGGAQSTAALAAGKALTHQADPYLRLLAILQTPGSPQLNYQRDVAPWLGAHAGIFLTSLSSSAGALLSLVEHGLLGSSSAAAFPFASARAQGAIVLDTSNAAKALSFLDAQAKHAGAHASSYKGVAFQTNSSGVAFGMVDRFAVIGSESGLRSVIETTDGASSLARASAYGKLLASAPANALAHLYTSAPSSTSASAPEEASSLLALLAGTREANISLVSSANSLALDADTLSTSSSASAGGLLAVSPEGAQALSELPGESWLAVGLGHVGATLNQDLSGLQSLLSTVTTLGGAGPESSAGLSLNGLLQGLTTPLSALASNSALARRDFTSWMGSAGIFASGGSLLELKGGVVIASKDPARSRAAVAELAAQLRKAGATTAPASIPGSEAAVAVRITGLPVVLDIAAGRDAAGQGKFVLGIGEASVEDALHPASTLSASTTRSAAASALGEGTQPSIIVELPTVLTLLESIGLTEAPSISKFVPYLRSITSIAAGGRDLSSEVQRFKLVLGLQSAGG
jgi:hypothetical protein